jgi:hypothetical protein
MHEWTEGNFRLIDERKSEDEFIDHFTAQVYDKLHDTWISVADGQWIVRGAKGEFYPCDDETFHWKYEELTHKTCGNTHPQADVYHEEGHWVVK